MRIQLLKLLVCFLTIMQICNANEQIYKNSIDAVFGIISISKGSNEVTGLGSGFFFSKECLAYTNAHVVNNKKEDEYIIFQKKTDLRAKLKLVAFSKLLDVAILKPVDKIQCKYLKISKEKIKAGQKVFALGNPLGLEGSITSGIVSGLDRSLGKGFYHRFIQVDAPIFPGNSGGALVNTKGEVIGINTARGEVGLGFALPIRIADRLKNELLANKVLKKRVIGLRAAPIVDGEDHVKNFLNRKSDGLLITNVKKGTPADKAGLRKNDRLFSVNDTMINTLNALKMEIYSNPVGSRLKTIFYRNNKKLTTSIEIATKR